VAWQAFEASFGLRRAGAADLALFSPGVPISGLVRKKFLTHMRQTNMANMRDDH
jgi:hypothetical protein